MKYFEYKGIDDDDLFIDFKLDLEHKDEDKKVFDLISQKRKTHKEIDIGHRE